MYGHQRRKTTLLDEGHANRRGETNTEKRRRLVRRKLRSIVVKDERQPGMEVLDSELSECGEAVMSHDAHRARRAPVATDGEAILIGIHVRISADGDAKMLPKHAGSDLQDAIRICDLCCFLAKGIEELERCLTLLAVGDVDRGRQQTRFVLQIDDVCCKQ